MSNSSNTNWFLKELDEAIRKQGLREATSDFPWVGKIQYATPTASSSDPNNMFDFRVMNDEDWEYLSEMNRAREEADKSTEKVRCKEHAWVNISLLSVKEVCKVCDVERDVVEGKKWK